MDRSLVTGRPALGLGVLGVALLLAAGAASRQPPEAAAAPKKEADHLIFRRTYGEALLEARVRNVPVFVSRHKDF